jgi:hypothetical protein
LYTTTFPCHECTKFIVGAGIVEVQYIEPYPKSMAGELYRDLINAMPPMQKESQSAELDRIPFRPFLGFGPGRYDEVFAAGRRRDGTRAAEHNKMLACPIGRGWNGVGVKSKEDQVVVAFSLATSQRTCDSKATPAGGETPLETHAEPKESAVEPKSKPKVIGEGA